MMVEVIVRCTYYLLSRTTANFCGLVFLLSETINPLVSFTCYVTHFYSNHVFALNVLVSFVVYACSNSFTVHALFTAMPSRKEINFIYIHALTG